jgi:hypothetical protein
MYWLLPAAAAQDIVYTTMVVAVVAVLFLVQVS